MNAVKLECCTPYAVPFPSGWQRVHSKTCAEHPNQKVDREAHPSGGAHIRLGGFEPHVKCRAANSWGGRVCDRCAPLVHELGCRCAPCRYADHHMDDLH